MKMEIRHQVRRLQFGLLPEYYGRLVEINMLPSVDMIDKDGSVRMSFVEDAGGNKVK